MKRKFVCIVCPSSCHVEVEYEGQDVKELHGVECRKGREFVVNEIQNPLRMLTGSVRVANGEFPLASVKTAAPIPKEYLQALGQLTHQIEIEAPVEIGQVIAENLLGEDIQLVATRKIGRKNEGIDAK